MKTLLIYNQIESELCYLILEGDYSRFHGVIVNSSLGNGFEQEFCDLFFDSETGEKIHDWSTDVLLIENKQWDKIAVCTFLM